MDKPDLNVWAREIAGEMATMLRQEYRLVDGEWWLFSLGTPRRRLASDEVKEAKGRGQIPEHSFIAEQLLWAGARCQRAIDLLQEIIATLTMQENAATFEPLPASWHQLVKRWRGRYLGILTSSKEGESDE